MSKKNSDLTSHRCIQMPSTLKMEDLPESIEINKAFTVNDIKYILVNVKNTIGMCENQGENTGEVITSDEILMIKEIYE